MGVCAHLHSVLPQPGACELAVEACMAFGLRVGAWSRGQMRARYAAQVDVVALHLALVLVPSLVLTHSLILLRYLAWSC